MIRPFATGFILALALACGAQAAETGPDLIFRKSTVFKLLTPNDKLATYGLDDPDVEGVACHYTVPVYMVYSDKLIEGSPKNSTSTVPIMPWGPQGEAPRCGDWLNG